jgi:hypothetical protein
VKVKDILKVIPYGNIVTIAQGSTIITSGQPNDADLQLHIDKTVSSVTASGENMLKINVYDRRKPVR